MQQHPPSVPRTYKSFSTVLAMVLTYALSTFYFGYSLVYLGSLPIRTLMRIYNITICHAMASGILNACLTLGALFGALFSHILVRKLSRRNSILTVNLVAFTAGLFVFLPSFYTLIIARFLQGLCVGCYSSLTSMIIKEIAPVQISGIMGSLVQVSIVSGQFFAYILVYILSKVTKDESGQDFWWIVFGVTLLTISLQTVLLLLVFPRQTAKYWLLLGNEQKALECLQQIYLPEHVQTVFEQKKKDVGTSKDALQTQQSQSSLVMLSHAKDSTKDTDSKSKLPLAMGLSMVMVNQFCGASAVDIYCSPIAAKSIQGELSRLMPSLILLSKLLAAFVAAVLLKKYGRRQLMLPGILLVSLALFSISAGFLTQSVWWFNEHLVVIGLFSYTTVYGSLIAPIVWLYTFEVVSHRQVWKVICTNWTLASFVVVLFPILQMHLLNDNPGGMFVFFGGSCLLLWLFQFNFMIQTKDKTERQIIEQFDRISLKPPESQQGLKVK